MHKTLLLAFFLFVAPGISFAQQDSCSCIALKPLPDLYTGTFAVYNDVELNKPYTGICHVYYMKVAYKIPDYTRTYQYGSFKDGEMQFWIEFNDKGDTLAFYHLVKHDSVIAESRQFNYQTGQLEARGIYYYTNGQKRWKEFRYRADGALYSESNYFFPAVTDSLNYGDSYINYQRDAVPGRDGFYNTPVQDGAYLEYGGAGGKQLITKGAYHNNSKSGKWSTWYESGAMASTGTYSTHNWKDGNWKEWYENGQLKSDIDYCNSNPCGGYREWYPNGMLKTDSHYKLQQRNWTATEYWENGNIKRRDTYSSDHLLKMEAWYSNGIKSWESSYSLDGKQIGTHKSWYENGQLRTITGYDSLGNHNSSDKVFYENGALRAENVYENGMRIRVNRYYETGVLKSEELFSNDALQGACRYYFPDGKIQQEVNYVKGVKQGTALTYGEDGSVLKEINYVNDQWDGICTWYFPGGKQFRCGMYTGGIRNGTFKEWNAQGDLVYDQSYRNGMRVNKSKSSVYHSRYDNDSLRAAYRMDVEVMAGSLLNGGDTIYPELTAYPAMKERMLSDLLSIASFIPSSLDSIMLVHADPSQQYTHIFLDYPIAALNANDTSACQNWPSQIDGFVKQLHLRPVAGECYGDDHQGIRRGFTSDLFFNGATFDHELKKLNPRFGCEYFTPANADPDPHGSAIRVSCHQNYSEYSFYLLNGANHFAPNYRLWVFRVYADGSVDYLEENSGSYSWLPEY